MEEMHTEQAAQPQTPAAPAAPQAEHKQAPKEPTYPVTPHGPTAGLEAALYPKFGPGAPLHLPVGVKEFIVKYGPYITAVLLALFAIPIVFFGGLAVLASIFTGHPLAGLATLVSIVGLVVEAIAIPGLMKRSYTAGWRFMFWAGLISALASLLSMSIFGLIIGLLVSWFFMFQIREYYK